MAIGPNVEPMPLNLRCQRLYSIVANRQTIACSSLLDVRTVVRRVNSDNGALPPCRPRGVLPARSSRGSFRAASGLAFCAAVTALLLTGCIHVEQRLELRANGSGRVSYHYSVAEETYDVLATAQALMQHWQGRPVAGSGSGLNWLFSRDRATDHFSGSGLRLTSYREYSKFGRKHVELSVSVEDIVQALSSGKFGLFSLSRTEDGNWCLRAELAADPGPRDVTQDQLQRLQALCDDLWLCLEVTAPSRIVETTAQDVRGKCVKWVFEPGRDGALLAVTPRVEVCFSGEALEWPESR